MTDEGKSETESWVEEKGAKYAYAYDKGGKLKGQLGVGGIPAAFLVDPTGKIVWKGHPGNLQASDVEKALTGALPKPMWEWPASAKNVRTALMKRKYADALSAAEKLSEEDQGPAIKTAIQSIISTRVETMKAALAEGNFLGADELADDLKDELEGLPEHPEAKKVADAIKADKEAAPVLKAQKAIRDMKGRKLTRSKEIAKTISDVKKIIKDHPGTFAEREAKDFLDELERRKRQD